ncbi:hypothetical protein [uncultured Thiothrix sp.]|uniref:hypothetical protein n=1 Tax=uncultured Thiothrix sp. TaxID=223185 RepID=UPI002619FD24|nr:hypothetical protein [uncultured Thiothrix sp.]
MTTKQTPELHTLLAATSYLLTRYAIQQTQGLLTCRTFSLAQAIHQHLTMVLQHPELTNASEAERAYQGLYQQWQAILFEHQQQAHCICERSTQVPTLENFATKTTAPSNHTLH